MARSPAASCCQSIVLAGSDLRIEGSAISAAAITLNNAAQRLEIGAAGSLTISAAQSIASATVALSGGTLTDSSGLAIGNAATLSGFGTVAADIASGAGTITAAGGTLHLTGTVASGPAFTIDTANASTLSFENTATAAAAISISSVNQTLAIGASGSLTISAAESITNGTISLSGGTLIDASGLTIGNGALLTGFGTIASNITATSGAIAASGGVLHLTGTVTGGTALIAANATLSLDTAPTGGTITFNSSSGVLRLTGTTVDVNQRLFGFTDTIAGLNVGSSTIPTNYIDLSAIASASIDSITLSGTTIQVTEVAGPVFNLTLAAAPSGFVNWTSDGGSGTAIFLAASPTYTARGEIDSWLDPSSWGGSVPPTVPVVGNFTFYNPPGTGNGGNFVPPGNDVILLPTSLGQATGSSVWTISDSRDTNQYTSSLSLTNQGIIYVNNTASLTPHDVNSTVNWSLFGDTALSARGMQLFQNDGILAVVGGLPGGTTTSATFTGNLSVTGSGYIDVYGNATLTFNTNVGVSSSQTFEFITDGNNTFGEIIEASALMVTAPIAGFLPGDELLLEGLGTAARPTLSVQLGDGRAFVSIQENNVTVDEVTFIGNFSSASNFVVLGASASTNGGQILIGATGYGPADSRPVPRVRPEPPARPGRLAPLAVRAPPAPPVRRATRVQPALQAARARPVRRAIPARQGRPVRRVRRVRRAIPAPPDRPAPQVRLAPLAIRVPPAPQERRVRRAIPAPPDRPALRAQPATRAPQVRPATRVPPRCNRRYGRDRRHWRYGCHRLYRCDGRHGCSRRHRRDWRHWRYGRHRLHRCDGRHGCNRRYRRHWKTRQGRRAILAPAESTGRHR